MLKEPPGLPSPSSAQAANPNGWAAATGCRIGGWFAPDPGVYYIFDKKLRQLETFLAVRGELEGVKLAVVKPIHYHAADGTLIPGYLTLPPGIESAHGLPAIVMPHGGPDSRDYWRFDWLAQFYASRGYAVLRRIFAARKAMGMTSSN